MNRKRQKFGKIFTPMMPGIRTVCNYFYQKNPTKIMYVPFKKNEERGRGGRDVIPSLNVDFSVCWPFPACADDLLLPSLYTSSLPSSSRDVRMDTLSQALTMLNAHAHSRLLVVDDAQGMFVASLLERLGGYGEVVGIHSGEYCNYDVIRYMNLPKAHQSILKTVSWARFLHPEDDGEWCLCRWTCHGKE